jgi:hypothetical protein
MVVRISEVQFHDLVRPGQRVQMRVEIIRKHEDGFELAGEGRIGDHQLISGFGCLATPTNAEEFINPTDFRTIFSEIYAPAERAAL